MDSKAANFLSNTSSGYLLWYFDNKFKDSKIHMLSN